MLGFGNDNVEKKAGCLLEAGEIVNTDAMGTDNGLTRSRWVAIIQ